MWNCVLMCYIGLYFYKKYGLYTTSYKHNQESSLKSFIENRVICGQTELSAKITDVMHGCKVSCILLFILRLELDLSIDLSPDKILHPYSEQYGSVIRGLTVARPQETTR
jgi:hypothetical protein